MTVQYAVPQTHFIYKWYRKLFVVDSISFMWQEYKTALRYTNRLLQIEPNNRQAIELQEKINDQMKKG